MSSLWAVCYLSFPVKTMILRVKCGNVGCGQLDGDFISPASPNRYLLGQSELTAITKLHLGNANALLSF